jgi:hypothetical protein
MPQPIKRKAVKANGVPFKTKAMLFKVTPEQKTALEQRAVSSGVRVSAWMRSILQQAVSQTPRKGYLRIREPNGETT